MATALTLVALPRSLACGGRTARPLLLGCSFRSAHGALGPLLRSPLIAPGACASRPSASSIARPIAPASPLPPHDAPPASARAAATPLAILPLPYVLRSFLLSTITASPRTLRLCLAAGNALLASRAAVFDIDRNPVLRWLVRVLFYSQFCAGETPAQVRDSCRRIKRLGFDGVTLEFGHELLSVAQPPSQLGVDDAATLSDIESWKHNMLTTIELTSPGDFAALKWSGVGNHALLLLKNNMPPTPAMERAINDVCSLAVSKGVRLCPSAEHEDTNQGIDTWTLNLMRRFNRIYAPATSAANHAPASHASPDAGSAANATGMDDISCQKVPIFITYQTYLRSTPTKISKHLQQASEQGFVLGVKLVRGAYLSSEPREAIWPTKHETDSAFDGIVSSLLNRQYSPMLPAPPGAVSSRITAPTNLKLATHNRHSVNEACRIYYEAQRMAQGGARPAPPPLIFAQLYGMADEVSFELLNKIHSTAKSMAAAVSPNAALPIPTPETFKFIAWGTMRQCFNYLLRRAAENGDAVSRTKDTQAAMGHELLRRIRSWAPF